MSCALNKAKPSFFQFQVSCISEELLATHERVSGFPETGADLFRGSPGNFRTSLGKFRGIAGLFLKLSGPVLRDTARLSQRYPPYCALWGFWCLNMANWVRYPLPLSERFPLESMRRGGAILPPLKGVSQRYLRDTL